MAATAAAIIQGKTYDGHLAAEQSAAQRVLRAANQQAALAAKKAADEGQRCLKGSAAKPIEKSIRGLDLCSDLGGEPTRQLAWQGHVEMCDLTCDDDEPGDNGRWNLQEALTRLLPSKGMHSGRNIPH